MNDSGSELQKSPLEGYCDISERAYKRRDLAEYTKWLFRDSTDEGWSRSSDRWLTKKPEFEELYLKHHVWKHYVSGQKDAESYYDWDLQGNIFGGLDEFFSKGATVLDLGSGHGKPVQEINEKYKDQGIICYGIDYRYGKKDYPEGSKSLLAGHFKSMPFADSSIWRILSVESFPTWLPEGKGSISKYMDEITRISTDGAMWRGTYSDWSSVSNEFLQRGWECYVDVFNNAFIAKLNKKDEKLASI